MNNKKKFIIVAGPCLAESESIVKDTATHLLNICEKYSDVDFYFKASYKKANRSSYTSFSGVGDKKALSWLDDVRKTLKIKVLTDIHSTEEAKIAAEYVDVLQIPAFLSRQTELLVAAAQTGLIVNIKKGQFLAPDDMQKAAAKVLSADNKNIWLTERGTSFGYHDLIVDFRSLLRMQEYGFPVIYDATHSLQLPSIGEQSGGTPEFVFPLARAAVATGIDGIFFETHPDPKTAKSDAQTQLPLSLSENFISTIIQINRFLNSMQTKKTDMMING